jgi:hypothetical protein
LFRVPATFATLAATLALAGCGIGPRLIGNDTGGIINWTPEHQRVARGWTAEHCARYGKVARISSVYPRYGQYIAFDCTFPRYR